MGASVLRVHGTVVIVVARAIEKTVVATKVRTVYFPMPLVAAVETFVRRVQASSTVVRLMRSIGEHDASGLTERSVRVRLRNEFERYVAKLRRG